MCVCVFTCVPEPWSPWELSLLVWVEVVPIEHREQASLPKAEGPSLGPVATAPGGLQLLPPSPLRAVDTPRAQAQAPVCWVTLPGTCQKEEPGPQEPAVVSQRQEEGPIFFRNK